MARAYKGLYFSEGLKMTYEDFEEVYKHVHVFKLCLPDEKQKRLKEAYKVATDGNIETSTNKRKRNKSGYSNEGAVSVHTEDRGEPDGVE